jgi:hypothetical protein
MVVYIGNARANRFTGTSLDDQISGLGRDDTLSGACSRHLNAVHRRPGDEVVSGVRSRRPGQFSLEENIFAERLKDGKKSAGCVAGIPAS